MYAILIILHFMFMLFLQSTVCHSTSTSSSTTSGCSTWTRTRSTTATCATKWCTKFYTTCTAKRHSYFRQLSHNYQVLMWHNQQYRECRMFSRMWPHHLYSILAKYLFPLSLHLVFQEHKRIFQCHNRVIFKWPHQVIQTHLNYFQEAIAKQAAAELLHKETKPEDPMMPIFHNSHFLAWITLAPVFHLLQAAAPLDLLVVTVQYQE